MDFKRDYQSRITFVERDIEQVHKYYQFNGYNCDGQDHIDIYEVNKVIRKNREKMDRKN